MRVYIQVLCEKSYITNHFQSYKVLTSHFLQSGYCFPLPCTKAVAYMLATFLETLELCALISVSAVLHNHPSDPIFSNIIYQSVL